MLADKNNKKELGAAVFIVTCGEEVTK